jgi:lipid-binding SYLF domain-containing protein
MKQKDPIMKLLLSSFAILFFVSCAHQNTTTMRHSQIRGDEALAAFYETHPDVKKIGESAVAYAVYPKVGKAAVGVGGAYGKGEVFERHGLTDRLVGYSELTQVNAGLQLGAQTFSEIIFFTSQEAFSKFKRGEIEMSADASAVALEKGKATKRNQPGFIIVVLDQKGLMGEVAIGGQ